MLHAGRTTFAYPGCPEGRGFDELGEKGFLFGEVGPNGADMAFVPFARRHYQILRADVTDAAPLDAVERLLPLRTQEDIYRIILTGERTEDFSLTALQSCLEDRFFQLELRDETRAPEDLWARAERTPCGVCSCRRCTASSSPPPRRIARPLNRRCASALRRWITATCKEDI